MTRPVTNSSAIPWYDCRGRSDPARISSSFLGGLGLFPQSESLSGSSRSLQQTALTWPTRATAFQPRGGTPADGTPATPWERTPESRGGIRGMAPKPARITEKVTGPQRNLTMPSLYDSPTAQTHGHIH